VWQRCRISFSEINLSYFMCLNHTEFKEVAVRPARIARPTLCGGEFSAFDGGGVMPIKALNAGRCADGLMAACRLVAF